MPMGIAATRIMTTAQQLATRKALAGAGLVLAEARMKEAGAGRVWL